MSDDALPMIRCTGGECPFKESCYRYIAEGDGPLFPFPPFSPSKTRTSGFECFSWWPLPRKGDVALFIEGVKEEEKKKKPFLRLV